MRDCKIVNYTVPAYHRIKLKESEEKNKDLDLARELKKKLWNMNVTIIPIVTGTFGTLTKGLLKGLEELEVGGRVETIQKTALLRTARILRRVLETSWCDIMWVLRQADDFFSFFFRRETKRRPELEISDETGSGGGKAGLREPRKSQLAKEPRKREQLAKEPREGQLAKREVERQLTIVSRRDHLRWVSSPEWTTVSWKKQWGRRSKKSLHS